MYKIIIIFLLLFFASNQLYAQVFPKEGSKLYYTAIGFSFPAQNFAVKYKIEIADGSYTTENYFEKNLVVSVYSKKNKIIAEVPSFGKQYTWRIVCISKDSTHTKSTLFHFSTKMTPDVDPAVSRLRIIKGAEKYKDAYVFIDALKTLYNMDGKPVWCFPGSDLEVNQSAIPIDIKLTPQGTITFMTGGLPYEINYNGDILWHYTGNYDPNNPLFHHEFTRLQNGHYMSLTYEDISGSLPAFFPESITKDDYDSAGFYKSRMYCSLVEFDQNNQLVWRWSSLDYKNNSDMRLRLFNDFQNYDHDIHENGFFFDEKKKIIYLSFKNISRVIKIKYPEGNVLNTYGTIYKPGMTNMENNLFCYQHTCRLSQKGYLYMYNNNISGHPHIPTIAMFREPEPGKSGLEKIWEYQCTVESPMSADTGNLYFYKGGSVQELPGQSFLVMMGLPYPKIFIVGLDKKIQWSAVPEKYNPRDKRWESFTGKLYRASIILNRKELEKLIWNSEKESPSM